MSSLPDLDQPPRRVGQLIGHLARRLRLRSESVLAPFGLRPRHVLALTMLRDHGGCSQQALTSMLEMDATNVVGLLNDLEAEKLVERRRSSQDRRRHVVELTDAGVDQLAKVELALAGVENEVFGALDIGQRETFYNLLQHAIGGDEVRCTEALDVMSAPSVCGVEAAS
jgi:DNA-binding MarR family transcriptional regulator